MTRCAWCELEFSDTERPVRLATSQPPWTAARAYGAARTISLTAAAFAASIRAAGGVEEIELWFHPVCWHKLRALLRTD